MVLLITFLTLLHSGLFAYDEYILKRKRPLSILEINSGIVDGVLYLCAVGMTIFLTYTDSLGKVYIFLAALSCISIAKNEFIYPADIDRKERIVHSFLYILHPLILYCFFISWQMDFFISNMTYWMLQLCYLVLGAKTITYHIVYWHFIHRK